MNFAELQQEVGKWSYYNFEDQSAHRPLLGVAEEVGELCHAHLKLEQGIRGDRRKHIEEAQDAVGDILVYLADYCERMGFDMQKIIEEVWAEVSKRDWKRSPDNGR